MNTLGHHQPTPPPTLATRMLQVLPAVVSVISLASLSRYHWMRLQGPVEPKSLPQHLYIKLYESFGFAPSLLFFLLVAVWSVMWFTTGRLERPMGRLGRLVVMAVLLGVALNIGAGSVAPGPQKGELGAWLGSVLVGMVGYFPSLLLVWAATIAALLLATDFFFADSFERLWRARSSAPDDAGVEAGVTEHLRQLGSALRPSPAPNGGEAVAHPAESLPSSASFAAAVAAAAAAAEAQERQVPEAETVDEAYRGDERVESPAETSERADEDRPLSYLERRRLREARRYARYEAEAEPEAESSTSDSHPFTESSAAPSSSYPADQPVSSLPSWSESPVAEPLSGEPQSAEPQSAETSFAAPPSGGPLSDEAPLDSDLLAVAPEMASEELPAGTVADPVGVVGDEIEELELDEHGLDEGDVTDDDPYESSAGRDGPGERPARLVGGGSSADRSLDHPAAPWTDEPPYVLPAASAEPPVAPEPVETPFVQQPVTPRQEPSVTIPRSELRAPAAEADGDRAGGRQQNLFAQGLEEGLVQEAVDLVVGARRATAGFLQRKLRIDYQLALELLAELAARGIVALEGDATQGRVVV